MFELKGKYNECKVFTDNIDPTCVGQIQAFLNQESMKDSQIRIMPDCHYGRGCVIGFTQTITDKVIPNFVGSDIGCGMHNVKLEEKRIELPKLDSVIRKYIPSGGSIRSRSGIHKNAKQLNVKDLYCFGQKNSKVNEHDFLCSMGTLGGGNHFCEVDKDDEGNLYLVVHTGSRKCGTQVAEYYQNIAYQEMKEKGLNISYDLSYCEGKSLNNYLHDMKIMQEYAYWNRKTIVDIILKEMKLHIADEFETIHNYIDMDNMILRKGSISAQEGERILIPINMRDGALICIGKGNKDWNYSAPHGAGRLMSRSEANNSIILSDFKKTMEGIYSTSISKSTIDESPFAYKSMEDIVNNIGDTAEIERIIKPIYNFKASEKE